MRGVSLCSVIKVLFLGAHGPDRCNGAGLFSCGGHASFEAPPLPCGGDSCPLVARTGGSRSSEQKFSLAELIKNQCRRSRLLCCRARSSAGALDATGRVTHPAPKARSAAGAGSLPCVGVDRSARGHPWVRSPAVTVRLLTERRFTPPRLVEAERDGYDRRVRTETLPGSAIGARPPSRTDWLLDRSP
jgi:hypothetical protein